MIKTVGKIGFIILLGISLFVESASSQGSNESCDGNRGLIESIVQSYQESFVSEDSRFHKKNYEMAVVVVARLGTKEYSAKYNLQRLKETKAYLVKAGMPESNIVIAQGERIKGKGRVEIYFGGFLYFYITLKPKQRLNLLKGGFCDYG